MYSWFAPFARLRFAAAIAAIAVTVVSGCEAARSTTDLPRDRHVLDLAGQAVDPFAGDAQATVLLFTTTQCPISNRYAPEVNRLSATYEPRGVAFWLVYPNAGDTPDRIRDHLRDYGYSAAALRDPRHVLVEFTGAEITPEAAVFAHDVMVYRGRIDNRYVDFGRTRPEPTERDLEEVLASVTADLALEPRTTNAVGCFIVEPP